MRFCGIIIVKIIFCVLNRREFAKFVCNVNELKVNMNTPKIQFDSIYPNKTMTEMLISNEN